MKNKRATRIRLAACALACVGLLSAISLAHADGSTFVPLAQYGSGRLAGIYGGGTGGLSAFINNLFRLAIAVGAIAAVLRLVYAGYLYMGQDIWSQKGRAREIIRDVTLGLFLLLAIWLILSQINPGILSLKALQQIKSSPVQSAGQGQNPCQNNSALNNAGGC